MKRTRAKIVKKINNTTPTNLNKASIQVFKSNLYTYASVVNERRVLKTFVTKGMKGKKQESAFEIGKMAAEFAKKNKLTDLFFNRSGYRYIGRIKAVAEGARAGGAKI